MRIAKYIGALLCVLLAMDSLLPIYLITVGLARGAMEKGSEAYFAGKLSAHVVLFLLSIYVAVRLWKSARAGAS